MEVDSSPKDSQESRINKILDKANVGSLQMDADDPDDPDDVDTPEDAEKVEVSAKNLEVDDGKKVSGNSDGNDVEMIIEDDSEPKTLKDDEKSTNSNNGTGTDVIDLDNASKKDSNEIIDLDNYNNKDKDKVKSANSRCINYECKCGKDMQIAPSFCLSYYRVKMKNSKKQEVCAECMDKAFQFNRKMVTCLSEGEFLVEQEFPMRNELVEIIDSDEETDLTDNDNVDTYFMEDDIEFINKNFVDVFNNMLNEYHFEDQVNYSVTYLKEKSKKLAEEFEEVDKMFKDAQKQVDMVRTELYSEFKRPTHNLPPIDIMDMPVHMIPPPIVHPPTPPSKSHDSTSTTPTTPTTLSPNMKSFVEQRDPERRSHRNIAKPVSYAEPELPDNVDDIELMEVDPSPITSTVKPIPPSSSLEEDVQIVSETQLSMDLLPPKGPVNRPKPKIGELYYAMKQSPFGAWGKVRVADIITKDDPNDPFIFKVKFEGKTKAYQYRIVSGKQLAYSYPSNVRLEVGTRIIAVFHDQGSLKKDNYFAGIIAEPMSTINNYRYLIFFDDGYAQYVHHNKVLVVCDSSMNVWDDIHKDSRLFIKKYLESYPERPMVKLQPGQVVKTEWSGKWWTASVVKVDGSLVQMYFESDCRTEWIYRGSTRLGPLFLEMQAAANRQEKGPHIRRQINQRKNVPYVEYTRTGGVEQINESTTLMPALPEQTAPPRAVARKSTARIPIINRPTTGIPFLPSQQVQQPQSKVVYFTPKSPHKPVPFSPHVCSEECKKHITLPLSQLKGYNPLSKPLLCGWHRLLYKYKGKKLIRYRAPCGRSIRTIAECHQYLRTTKSEMSVDMFDFDYWVHCLAEFVLDKTFRSKKDISNGMENVPIPCVNYVDNTLPDFCNYSTKREPMEGVSLNLDEEFLCGCDCEDDCLDKSKCQCWQLTIREHRTLNKKIPDELIGYSYKRLPEFVTTGIYECNSKCKCRATCLNRVVQHPLQLKLQLFKTANRGWGIRCLNDIPQGAFICIYAGSLLTDKMANEGGVNYGDEYLAELDYIEVVEKQKDGYESDVEDIEEGNSEKSKEEEEDEEDEMAQFNVRKEDDKEYVCEFNVSVPKVKSPIRTRSQRQSNAEDGSDRTDDNKEEEPKETKPPEDECVTISDDEDTIREPSRFDNQTEMTDNETIPKFKSVRKMFGDDEVCYIMDAKNMGNIGRYLNHSCSPNVFVQNVFVDTHDLRFPWVAFFAMNYIRAGTELTWNYNYDVGSVPGKVIFCHCGSLECRGRLL